MIDGKRTPEEDAELESLMERAWSGEALSVEEKARGYILEGVEPELALWIAQHGFPKE